MERIEFIDKLLKASKEVDQVHVLDVLRKSINSNKDNNPRGHRNLIIVMEELSELQKEVSKELRGKGQYHDILQELADVYICIEYIQEICDISDDELARAVNVKLDRLESVLEEQGEYQ
jgi:NTP pyrophosphatase (non-canonical NTP hydrolase)